LLTQSELDALSEVGNLQALTAALARTSYRRPLEAALVHLAGRQAILRAIRDNLETTLASVRHFYRGRAGNNVEIVLRAYDIRNLKAVLRGLSSQAAPDEIRAVLLPVGELSSDVLSELIQAPNPRAAIDLLATMALPFAAPLLRLRAERPGASTLEMELRLDQWYFEQAMDTGQG
jgi:vacuolar-type H+-ATPase subunit C/Vma6